MADICRRHRYLLWCNGFSGSRGCGRRADDHGVRLQKYWNFGGHGSEDAVQAALTKLYLRWSRLDDIATVESYVRRIIVNSLIDEGRRGWFRRESVSAGLPEVATVDDLASVSADRLAVLAALARVPQRQRAVLVLRYWEDQSVEQVAILLGCSPGTVKSQAARGLRRLRELLDTTMTARSEEPV